MSYIQHSDLQLDTLNCSTKGWEEPSSISKFLMRQLKSDIQKYIILHVYYFILTNPIFLQSFLDKLTITINV